MFVDGWGIPLQLQRNSMLKPGRKLLIERPKKLLFKVVFYRGPKWGPQVTKRGPKWGPAVTLKKLTQTLKPQFL
jgi:hypothetical protein